MPVPSFSRRDSVWEWAQVVLLAANLSWTTLCLGGYLAKTMVVTSTLTAVLLAVHAIGGFARRNGEQRWMCLGRGHPQNSSAEPSSGGPLFGIHPAGLLFIPFLVYGAANAAWVTPVQWLGWFDWFGWAQMVAVFWVVLNGIRSRRAQSALGGTLMILAVVAVFLACYQRFVRPDWLMLGRIQPTQYAGRASGPFGIPNSLGAFLLLLIPVTGALSARRRAPLVARVFFGWLAAILILGLGLTISRGAWLGLTLALAGWPLLGSTAPWRRRLAIAGLVVCGASLVGGVSYGVSPQVRERFVQLAHDAGERSRPILWRAAWNIFLSHPITGSGAGSYDALFEKYRPEGFIHRPIWAHNDYLNTLSDYGAVGFVLFFGAAAVVGRKCLIQLRRQAGGNRRLARGAAEFAPDASRLQPPLRASEEYAFHDPLVQQAIAIGLLAFALQLFVDFHFKIPALAMVAATVAGLLVGNNWKPKGGTTAEGISARLSVAIVMLAGVVAILRFGVPAYRAEALRDEARTRIDGLVNEPLTSHRYRDEMVRAKSELGQATMLAPGNGNTWSDRAYALAQWSRIVPQDEVALGREAEADADQAIRLGPVFAEFWIRRGVARDMQHRQWDAAADFTRAISLSPKAPYTWYYYAYHLSLSRNDHDMALAMVDFCLRLDPKNQEAVRLRQRLAVSQLQP